MLIDARSLESNVNLDCDICIMGAGAAGITMALELSNTPLRVCLLESGGLELEDETQALYSGRKVDQRYPDLDVGRLRMFGGTTNHWAGSCGLLDHLDFQSRPWVAYSGWPVDGSHLERFYRRARSYCQLGPFAFDPDLIGNRPGIVYKLCFEILNYVKIVLGTAAASVASEVGVAGPATQVACRRLARDYRDM